jgi:hypothetical protein
MENKVMVVPWDDFLNLVCTQMHMLCKIMHVESIQGYKT